MIACDSMSWPYAVVLSVSIASFAGMVVALVGIYARTDPGRK